MFGLIIVGFYGTIGSTGGFGNGAWAGTMLGGILSLPWFAALLAVIWNFPDFYWRHLLAMCVIGPAVVCGSWWLLDGSGVIDAVMVAAVAGTLAFLVIIMFRRGRRASADS